MATDFSLPCVSFRNLLGPTQGATDKATVQYAVCHVSAVVNLPENLNVRAFLGERKYSGVHSKILESLQETPDDFVVLNGGLTVVASKVDFDNKSGVIRVKNPSIINGSQTRGVIADFLADLSPGESTTAQVQVELIETDSLDLVRSVAVSRNVQTMVKSLSILGRMGLLDDLEKAFKASYPEMNVRKSESDPAGPKWVDAATLVQMVTCILPSEVLGDKFPRSKPYSAKQTCEYLFKDAMESRDSNQESARLVRAYLDLCGPAFELFQYWGANKSFRKYKSTGNGVIS